MKCPGFKFSVSLEYDFLPRSSRFFNYGVFFPRNSGFPESPEFEIIRL